MNSRTLAGMVLIAAGTAGFWFGAVPFKHEEEVVKLGAVRIKGEVDDVKVPKPVSAGAIAAGTLLMLIGGRKK